MHSHPETSIDNHTLDAGSSLAPSSQGCEENSAIIPKAKRLCITEEDNMPSSSDQVEIDGIGAQFINDKKDYNPVYKEELVRLMLQSLKNMGYHKSVSALENESGHCIESNSISTLRDTIQQGQWESVVDLINELHIGNVDQLQEIKFLIYEQQYLEFLESKRLTEALQCLRQNLAPLGTNEERLRKLSSLLMCSDVEVIKKKANWSGSRGGSRQELIKNVQAIFPASLMMKDSRLDTLIDQALSHQKDNCLFHNSKDNYISLLENHKCASSSFPTTTLFTLSNHNDEVWFVKFSNDGSKLASASKDQTVIIWDIVSMSMVHVLRAHSDALSFVAWSPDDQLLLTCSNDRSVIIWDTKKGTRVSSVSKHTQSVTSCAWLPDGKYFVSAGLDQKIYLWDLDGNLKNSWSGIRVNDMAVTHDGNYIVAICYEKKIRIIGVSDGSERSIQEAHSMTSLCLSKNSRHILVNLSSQEIHLWDLEEKKLLKKYYGQTQGRFVIRTCFGGYKDSFVVSGSEDCQVYIWHRRNGSLLGSLPGHHGTVNSVAWNPTNPNMFASASDDCTIRIWGHQKNHTAQEEEANGLSNTETEGDQNWKRKRITMTP